MSLATRCSHCGTAFKVAQDHLQASEGWVRCGRCREVFNAIEGMFEVRREASVTSSAVAELLVKHAPTEPTPDEAEPLGAPTPPTDNDVVTPDPGTGWAATQPASEVFVGPPSLANEGPALDGKPDEEPVSAPAVAELADEPAHSPVTAEPAAISGLEGEATPGASNAEAITAGEIDTDAVEAIAPDEEVAKPVARTEDDARDLKAARVSLFGPDSNFEGDSIFGPDSSGEPLERMSLWPSPTEKRPHKTRRRRPKARAFRHDRDFELSETTLDVLPMPSIEAVDHLIASNERDTRFVEYEPEPGFATTKRRPRVRLVLRVAAILLGVTLGLQGLLHGRDSIAARWPSTEGALRQLCAPFGCTIDAPRDLQALQVQSVSFNETANPGIYRLNVVLLNQDESRVKMPALDLRITDTRGDTLVRRVLTAAELGNRNFAIQGQGEATLQAVLRIEQPDVSGYDVTVFYP